MRICIGGNGSFGYFLKEILPKVGFEIADDAYSVILAVPISTYEKFGRAYAGQHLINVCSIQSTSTKILLNYSSEVTSIHPLFGRRTPIEKRNSILTYRCHTEQENDFLDKFARVSKIYHEWQFLKFTPESHDKLMARTHYAAILAAKQAKILTDRAEDVPDELIPHSFRLLRQFVQTINDVPSGTMESILANPYA